MSEFHASQLLIAAAKTLKDERNSNSVTHMNKKKKDNALLDSEIEARVIEFYESEENSRQQAGKKDVK